LFLYQQPALDLKLRFLDIPTRDDWGSGVAEMKRSEYLALERLDARSFLVMECFVSA